MNRALRNGFTLIELLTVIAIIAILAALTMTIGPRMIERAKMRRLESAMRQVSISLAAYYTDHSTYPPAYGYVAFEHRGNLNAPSDPAADPGYYNLVPYMVRLRYHGNIEMYDEFSLSYDTDNDNRLSLLEFSPHGRRNPAGTYDFDWTLPRYIGQVTPVLGEEITLQMNADRRPFIYVPVNKQQFSRAQRYWLNHGAEYAQRWNPADPDFPQLTFPPNSYDAFVLIGMGPGAHTFGLLPDPLGVAPESANNYRDLYHITGLRAYFLATRDLNANGVLDFDFRTRTQQGEAAQTYEFAGRTINNNLPSPTMPAGFGPVILVSQ